MFIPTRTDALVIEWHVFLVYDQSANAFLAMPRREFVAQFGPPSLANQDLYQRLIILCVTDHDLIDNACDCRLVSHRRVLVRHTRGLSCERVVIRVHRRLFVNVDVARFYPAADASQAVLLDDGILLLRLSVIIQWGVC